LSERHPSFKKRINFYSILYIWTLLIFCWNSRSNIEISPSRRLMQSLEQGTSIQYIVTLNLNNSWCKIHLFPRVITIYIIIYIFHSLQRLFGAFLPLRCGLIYLNQANYGLARVTVWQIFESQLPIMHEIHEKRLLIDLMSWVSPIPSVQCFLIVCNVYDYTGIGRYYTFY